MFTIIIFFIVIRILGSISLQLSKMQYNIINYSTTFHIISPWLTYFITRSCTFWSTLSILSTPTPNLCKAIQPVHPKGDQSWVFIGRTDAEAEIPILWPPHVKSWLIGKDPDAGRDCGQEEKGTTEDKMAGWHHRLNGHEFG